MVRRVGKIMKKLIAIFILAQTIAISFAWGDESSPSSAVSLEEQLQQLNLPSNQAPVAGVSSTDRLYAVQSRYAPLRFKHELTLGGGHNFTSDSFVDSNLGTFGYRFHFSDRWSLGLTASLVNNRLSGGGKRLLDTENLVPDVAFAKNQEDLTLGYNVFYGKFRLSMEQVFYFDQYVQLGVGSVELNTGRQPMGVADVGFSFWLGKSGSLRVGLKDCVYNEKRRMSQGLSNNFVGHIDVGLMLGGERI